jgi:hypothetical protein
VIRGNGEVRSEMAQRRRRDNPRERGARPGGAAVYRGAYGIAGKVTVGASG